MKRSGTRRGCFITLEGIEGSGKSTHVARLVEGLRERGFTVLASREPGGTPLGESLRGLLLGVDGDAPVPRAELLLMLASRAQHVQQVIEPALARGEVVVVDRYADASVAYQGAGRGLGVDTVREANRFATGGLVPDRTILIDLPLAEALERIATRRRKRGVLDRFDDEDRRFYETVQQAYRDLAAAQPDRVRVVQSTEAKPRVAEQVLAEVLPLLAKLSAEGRVTHAGS